MKIIKFTDEEINFLFDSLHETWHRCNKELQNPEKFRIPYLSESKKIANELMTKISKKQI
jgi:hypothetical protein